jgi:hypothetical protein
MRTLGIVCFLMIAACANAQVVDAAMDKWIPKYNEGEFEWVLKKAEALMEDEKAKKTPEPYMWAAMCNLALYRSEDAKLKDTYKAGLRDALKFAAKAATKDSKEMEFISAQKDFLTDLKKEGIALAQSYIDAQDVRKANYTFKQILAFDPKDDNIQFAKAITDIKMSNTVDADKSIAEALPRLEANYRDLNFKPDPISSPLLRDAVIYYIDHLTMLNLKDSALQAVFIGRMIYPLDEEIKKKGESLK